MAPQQCSYCQINITSCRIKCSECPEFVLCLQCFSCGAENGGHKREHSYQVLTEDTFAVFGGKTAWRITEEEQLLEAIDICSFGNWDDIADQVKLKTAEECREHYYTYFVNGNIGRATLTHDQSTARKVKDHTSGEKGVGSTSVGIPNDLSIAEQQELGYMPLRDEFEREYDNDAELSIGNLTWNFEDEELDVAYTLFQVDVYRRRQKDREPRKRLAKEFRIVQNATSSGAKKLQAARAKQSKDERELRDRMRLFGRFQRLADHEQMNLSMLKERRAKNRIKELVKHRRNGITKSSECAVYEEARIAREKKKEMKKQLSALSTSGKPLQAASKKGKSDDSPLALSNRAKLYQSLPGYELLTERERGLCQSIGLKPAVYITIKTCFIRDYLQKRHGVTSKIRYPSQLDKARRQRILTFFSDNGWIAGVS